MAVDESGVGVGAVVGGRITTVKVSDRRRRAWPADERNVEALSSVLWTAKTSL